MKILRLPLFIAMLILLTACGQAPAALDTKTNASAVLLPTRAPTPEKTATSTRVISLTPLPTATITPIPNEVQALAVGIIDSNTIAVVMAGDSTDKIYPVRYLGIKPPPVGSPWGNVAFDTTRKMVAMRVVRLVRDVSDFDEEGYLLRHVYMGNQLLSLALLEQGLVQADVSPPDTRFKEEILAAEARAKADKLGLWSGHTPTPTPSPAPKVEGTTEPESITPIIAITTTVTTTVESIATVEPTTEITATVEITPTETSPQN